MSHLALLLLRNFTQLLYLQCKELLNNWIGGLRSEGEASLVVCGSVESNHFLILSLGTDEAFWGKLEIHFGWLTFIRKALKRPQKCFLKPEEDSVRKHFCGLISQE